MLASSWSLNRCSVSGCSGALMVTTSQTFTIDCGVACQVRFSSFSTDSGRQWRSV